MKYPGILLFFFMLTLATQPHAEETQNKNEENAPVDTIIAETPDAEQTGERQLPIEFMLKNTDTSETVAVESAPDMPVEEEASATNIAPEGTESVQMEANPDELPVLQASISPEPAMLTPTNSGPTPTAPDNDNSTWDVSDFEHGLQLFSGKQPAPALTLTDMDGKTHDLQEYLGKVVLLNFWQTDCPSCVKEISSLESLQKRFPTDNFVVLSVDMGEDEERVATFMDNFPVGYPVMLDPDNSSLQSWKLRAYPSTFLIDREGYLRLAYFGGLEWDEQSVVDTLAAEMELAAQ